jgi:hypothetical protein
MPTVRKRITRPAQDVQITPEAARLFRTIIEIQDAGLDEIFESEGGRRNEYQKLREKFDELLKWKPWIDPPYIVPSFGEPPAWERRPEDYRATQQLRRALEELAEELEDADDQI